jgi:hypothetical protein
MATVTLTDDRTVIMPGDTVNFQATIASPSIVVGGIFVAPPDLGTLGAASDSGLTLSDGGLTHSSPKAATGGSVTFDFTWTAPSTPGATIIDAYGLAANGNGRNTGDVPGQGSIQFAWGCDPVTVYFDADGDGHGNPAIGDRIGCPNNPPMNYAVLGDDCDDAHATVYPGAPERCNGKDDNCNGLIDEGTSPETLYADPDGDGYYAPGTMDTVVGCLPYPGYADQPGDCAPNDATRHPGAVEVCNSLDDNCDGFVDENVRPRCGVGRCERESASCDAAACVPGMPLTETCNGLDDDCNGVVDDGEPCAAGTQCLGLHCVAIMGAGGSGAQSSSAAGGSPSSGAGGTGNGGMSTVAGMPSSSVGGVSSGGATPGTSAVGSGAIDGTSGSAEKAAARGGATKTGCSLGRDSSRSLAGPWLVLGFALFVRRRSRRAWF